MWKSERRLNQRVQVAVERRAANRDYRNTTKQSKRSCRLILYFHVRYDCDSFGGEKLQ